MLARAHVGWGLAVSLLLHLTGIAALTLALPRLNVRPGVIRRVEMAIVQLPPPSAASAAPPPPAATPERDPEPEPASTLTTPAPKPKPHKPKTVPQPPKLQSPIHPDSSSDGSTLERVLRQIAATTELTQDERRRAMLVVLRTWEDPSGKHSADELIEALLKNVRQARTAQPPETPASKPSSLQP